MDDVSRDDEMRQWVETAPDEEAVEHEREVMWGVWFNLDDIAPPAAMFSSEGDAKAFAVQSNRPEWDVSPCVVSMKTRNSVDVPGRSE